MYDADIADLARVIHELDDADQVAFFLRQILTPAEVDDVNKRWELVKRVYAGIPQRRIAGELGISLCKVTRGSKELKRDNSLFRAILDRENDASRSA